MSAIEEDELMRDDPNEIPIPVNLDEPAPDFFRKIWDDPHIRKITFQNNKKGFHCFWCQKCFKTGNAFNATKALCHLGKVPKQDIAVCTGPITPDFIACYAKMLHMKKEAKVAKGARVARFHQQQELHSERVAASIDQKRNKGRKAPPTTATPSNSSPMTIAARHDSPPSAGRSKVQTKLTLDAPNPAVERKCTTAITRMIHCLGLPFWLSEDHLFRQMIDSARYLPRTFQFPNREQIGGTYLDANFEAMQEDTYTLLKLDIEIFMASLMGDGATVHKLALFNILGVGAHCRPSILEVCDCKSRLADGQGKDARFLYELFKSHIERIGARNIDSIFVDGASNVQAAGKLLEVEYPWMSCLWGAEHIVSLWFNDVANEFHVTIIIRVYKRIYKWLGGSVQIPYAVLQRTSAANNEYSSSSLALIRASDTRMGGHFIALLRLCRMKQSILDCVVTSQVTKSDFPSALKAIVMKQQFWDVHVLLLRTVAPMLRVLRLADMEQPCMDKLKYFTRMAGKIMRANAQKLEDAFISPDSPQWEGSIWDDMQQFLGSSAAAIPDDEDFVGKPSTVAPDDVQEPADFLPDFAPTLTKSFAGNFLLYWKKRLPCLDHDYAIAGWFLSPVECVREDVAVNHMGSHKTAMVRILKKLIIPQCDTEAEQLRADAHIISTFWTEWNEFRTKRGPFQRCWIWAAPEIETRPDLWHQNYSLAETQVLGRIGCIICSKLLGSGPCERSHGDYKHQKGGKRSHLSGAKAEKQAAIFGKYCGEKARVKRKEDDALKVEWDEDDFEDLGFSKFGINIDDVGGFKEPPKPVRKFFAFVEPWETEAMTDKNRDSSLLLLRKYGGIQYYNIDKGFESRTIDRFQMKWSDAKMNRCWTVSGNIDGSDNIDDSEKWKICDDLFFQIRCFYKKNDPDGKELKVITYEKYKGLDRPAEDEHLVDEWIANGGKFDSKPAAKPSSKKPAKSRYFSGGRRRKKPAAKKAHVQSASSSDESSSDEEPPKKKKSVGPTILLSSGSGSGSGSDNDDDDDSDSTEAAPTK